MAPAMVKLTAKRPFGDERHGLGSARQPAPFASFEAGRDGFMDDWGQDVSGLMDGWIFLRTDAFHILCCSRRGSLGQVSPFLFLIFV